MSRSPIRSRAVLSVLSLCLSACGGLPWEENCKTIQCSPCPPALTVRVRGAPGQPVPEVVLGSGQGSCSRDAEVAICNPSQSGPGRYVLDLQAPGYQPLHLEEEVPAVVESTGCCHCSYDSRLVDVRLVPE